MTMSTLIRRACAVWLCLLGTAAAAFAQAPGSDRPYRGLFGSARGPVASQTWDVTATIVEAFDQDILAEGGSLFGPVGDPVGGYFTMLTAGSKYQSVRGATQWSANVASTFAYYNDLGDVRSISHTGAVGFGGELGRTRVLVNQALAYSPSYLFGLFPSVEEPAPGLPIPGAPDYQVDNEARSYSSSTMFSVSRPVTRRGRVTASAQYTYVDFQGAAVARRPDVTSYSAQAGFSRNMSRNAALRFGYVFRGGDIGGGTGSESTSHGIDIGAQYSRPLSATRRAFFSFTLGSSALDAAGEAALAGQNRLLRTHGSMSAAYQFSSRWQARGNYRRELQYVPEFAEAVYTDGIGLALDGLLSSRFDFLATAGYATGASPFSRDAITLKSYTGDVRIRFALTRTLALYAEYLYYFYEYQARTPLTATVPPSLERNGVRVGLSTWVPLLRR
jgi:hypothetical protein